MQLRLQRIVEVNIRQSLIERVLQTGSLIIDVQGDDDTLTLEYMRKPAVVQRVINSQINEIVGGGRREDIPEDLRPKDAHPHPPATGPDGADGDEPTAQYDAARDSDEYDTPPFGVTSSPTGPSASSNDTVTASKSEPSEIRDRLIELDDLRRRGIISEDEFATKKSELLDRI